VRISAHRVLAAAIVFFVCALVFHAASAGSATKPRHVCVVYDLLVQGKQILAGRPLFVVPCPGASKNPGAA
jgi:heme A synthase